MKSTARELLLGDSRPKTPVLEGATKTKDCYNVLFVCCDNSACSIIAEAILERWGAKEFRAFSAGIHPATEIQPFAIDLMKAQRLWKQSFKSKGCDEYLKPDARCMNFIICIGEQRPNDFPAKWPGNPSIIHWRISSPISDGQPEERALAFRKTFKELENRIRLFILIYERERVKKAAA